MTISLSPGLTELMRLGMAKSNEALFVALPGKVVSYDAATQTAHVKPLLKRRTTDKNGNLIVDTLGQINDAPVIHPRGGGYYTHIPLKSGDNVLLLFCDRSIEEFMGSGGGEDLLPNETRTNDISDAVVIPGFNPDNKALKDVNANDFIIGHESTGAQIKMEQNGAVDINNGNLKVLL